jgi:hypothetical protein
MVPYQFRRSCRRWRAFPDARPPRERPPTACRSELTYRGSLNVTMVTKGELDLALAAVCAAVTPSSSAVVTPMRATSALTVTCSLDGWGGLGLRAREAFRCRYFFTNRATARLCRHPRGSSRISKPTSAPPRVVERWQPIHLSSSGRYHGMYVRLCHVSQRQVVHCGPASRRYLAESSTAESPALAVGTRVEWDRGAPLWLPESGVGLRTVFVPRPRDNAIRHLSRLVGRLLGATGLDRPLPGLVLAGSLRQSTGRVGGTPRWPLGLPCVPCKPWSTAAGLVRAPIPRPISSSPAKRHQPSSCRPPSGAAAAVVRRKLGQREAVPCDHDRSGCPSSAPPAAGHDWHALRPQRLVMRCCPPRLRPTSDASVVHPRIMISEIDPRPVAHPPPEFLDNYLRLGQNLDTWAVGTATTVPVMIA